MDDGTYVLFLVLGIALVVADGQIIYRSGLRYLADSYGEDESARSMARLVSVLFHFAVLGVLLLISAIDLGGDTQLVAMVRKLGVVLLLLAVAHALTIRMLTRMRDRLDAENLTKQRYDHMQHNGVPLDSAPTPPAGAVDSEDIARANGTAETRLSRAPGAEPGVGTVPAGADGTVPAPRAGRAVPGQDVPVRQGAPVRPDLGPEAVARRGGVAGPDGH
ncbi:hypothetical protein [Actinokineospora terrae]|uniref:Uncharacterized protein n=1 Tax=Actinokineospora terrae TaxID=155974 RepID=A0A1H9K781_9PSEU|nr:hypothetical protein [Actinokineospora terrae]SEQ94932.1 hypothetical protein SAMN04487818_10149 [Actinokineospora terrae]